jgi:hypothetical protein
LEYAVDFLDFPLKIRENQPCFLPELEDLRLQDAAPNKIKIETSRIPISLIL